MIQRFFGRSTALIFIVVAVSAGLLCQAAVAAVTGSARVTSPDQTASLNSGGSATQFSVVPAPGARCEGDSAHDGYFVFSYLVPKGVDPRSVSFIHIAPSKGFGLRTTSHYYGAVTTEPGTGSLRQTPPNFVWSRLSADQLISSGRDEATWEGGLACESPADRVTSIWNFEIAFHRSASDPRGFVWTIPHPAPTPSSNSPWVTWVVIGVLGLGGAALYSWSRSKKPTTSRQRLLETRDHRPDAV